jgi:hypothetical protein
MWQEQSAASNYNTKRRTGLIIVILTLVAALANLAVQPAQAQSFTVLHTFTGTDGAGPQARLTMDSAGNLYGTAAGGGSEGGGTAFKLSQKNGNWTFALLYSFYQSGSDAAAPRAVVLAPDGSLYGSSRSGGGIGMGTLFRLQPPATFCPSVSCPWDETVVYRFQGHGDGCDPHDIVFDSSGNIVGAASDDVCGAWGTVYEFTPSGGGGTETVLYSFTGHEGALPNSGLFIDTAGNMYGTTEFSGGSGFSYYDFGSVYQLAPSGSGWTFATLYSFTNNTGGAYPEGINNAGTLFQLMPGSGGWAFNLLFTFSAGYPCGPPAPLAMDSQGNLYGVTSCAGQFGYGNVFELTPSGNGWTYSDLHDFTSGSDGAGPAAAVIVASNGNIYGTTSTGGSHGGDCGTGCGVVWEITP